MKLVIAEKPSVALSIAKVLGAGNKKNGYYENEQYIVSWCVGHLVGLAEPEKYGEEYKNWSNLPILPKKWIYEIKTKDRFDVLKMLMEDTRIDSLVCATDAGREGELIFRHTYNKAGCKKPFERLWISSLEDSAIKKGFENLKNGKDYDNLYCAALCRERADWIVGINATRFFTTLYKSDKALSIGRVQTPTLAMLVNRDNEIKNFVKEKYFTIEINCGEFFAYTDKITDREEADRIYKICKYGTAMVTDTEKEEKQSNPPKLYDLTSLQREANRIFGFTAQQTLDGVQRLYDNKLSTYPRTDSQFLTEDMEETAREIIEILLQKTPFAKDTDYTALSANVKSVMNNKKVSDHHAIIPTANIKTADFEQLTDTDRKLLYLISARLISATAEKHIYENTTITLNCNDIIFKAKGKIVISKGYRQIEDNFLNFLKCKSDEKEQENKLPSIQIDNKYNVTGKIVEHYTQPPKPFTEDTLLSAMERAGNADYETDEVERKGLGTPATRANIIETIISRGYAERSKKQLIATDKGKKLIELVPEAIKSPKLTAEWENKLVLVAKGKLCGNDFMNGINGFIEDIVSNTTIKTTDTNVFFDKEIIGKCPRCGNDILEGKLNFYCSNKDCEFVLWKKNKFWESKKKEITKAAAKKLLSDGKVHYKDLFSEKTGKTYEADILLDDTGGKYVNFKLEFPNKN